MSDKGTSLGDRARARCEECRHSLDNGGGLWFDGPDGEKHNHKQAGFHNNYPRSKLAAAGPVFANAATTVAEVEVTPEELVIGAKLGVTHAQLKAQKEKDAKALGLHLSHAERRSRLQADLARSGLTLTNAEADEALRTGG